LQQHCLQQSKLFSREAMGRQRSLQQHLPQVVPQAGSQALTGQQAFSQQAFLQQHLLQHLLAQLGSQHLGFTQQAGSQALTGQQGSGQQALAGQQAPQAFSQQQGLQLQTLQQSSSLMPANKSRTGVGRQVVQQFFSQVGSQHFGCSQAGWQAFTGQQGSGQQALTGSQQALAQALHSPQPPQLFSPSKRSRSSSPNPWLHRAALRTSAINIVLLFIEQQLLYSERLRGKMPPHIGRPHNCWGSLESGRHSRGGEPSGSEAVAGGRHPRLVPFARCTAPGPSSLSLARFYPIRLPDAP
jgi:hypothetical protein